MEKVFIIAEAGVNHNGSLELALRLIDAGAEAGADAVKFQTFKASALATKDAKKAAYQNAATSAGESQFDMLKRLELDESSHTALADHCRNRKVLFLSTPFDSGSVDLLASMGMGIFKIPSGEITNLPHLRKIGSLGKSVILSTGMSDLGDIEKALAALADAGTPREKVTVLHATTEYPAPMGEVNLKAMTAIREAFGVKVGYSDHTPGIEIPIAAVALGACVIEKHFTLDRTMDGPDHKASLEPDELKAMIRGIRNVEYALGDGIKRPTASEIPNMAVARKSLVAAVDIRQGEVFTDTNLAVKRPGNGISPMRWDEWIGKPAPRDYREGERL